MSEEKKKTFPKIAQSNWSALRDKFKQRVPAEVSASYVATALGMDEDSARSNVVAPLKAFGIVGEDGKPTELAYEWRDDGKYKDVCERIIQNVYPQELHDLFHGGDVPVEALTSWFMRNAKVGEPAAKMFARTYSMLIEADPEKIKEGNGPRATSKPTEKSSLKKVKSPRSTKAGVIDMVEPKASSEVESSVSLFKPNLHIDVQIHIAPESSPELIDKIFESMSKHLRGLGS